MPLRPLKKAHNIRLIGEAANHQAELYRVFCDLTGARCHPGPQLDVSTCEQFTAHFCAKAGAICRDFISLSMVMSYRDF